MKENNIVYLDNAATTRPYEDVVAAYLDVAAHHFGNPSSLHLVGYDASHLLREARDRVLSSLGVNKTHEAVFTSGATESNNLFLFSVARRYQNRGKKIITSMGEHPSVLNVFKALEKEGFEAVYLPLALDGAVDPEDLRKAMDKNTILVSIMGVNNETGAISDLRAMSAIVKGYPKCFFHSDLTQAVGKVDVPYSLLDAFSFSGHKIGALKGSGALVYRKNIAFPSYEEGGEQEGGHRPGTVDVAGSYALSLALERSMKEAKENEQKVALLRDKMVSYLERRNNEFAINSPASGSPYLLSFSLLKKKAAVYVEGLSEEGIAVSSVSACSSKRENTSYVIEAMGLGKERAAHVVRMSFAPFNAEGDIDRFIAVSDELLGRLVNQR